MAIVRFSLQMGDRLPVANAVIYKRGAIVSGTQTNVNAVVVHGGHDIAVNHKFYYALSRSNIIKTRVFTCTVSAAGLITYSGAPFTWVDGSFLVPLGTDSGATAQPDGSFSDPNYDGSTATVYSDPAGDGSYTSARVPVEPGGDLGFWSATADLWVLAKDSRGRIVRFYIMSQSSTGGSGGTSIAVDTSTATPGDPAAPSFLVVRNGGTGDILYMYLKDSAGAYHWEQVMQIA